MRRLTLISVMLSAAVVISAGCRRNVPTIPPPGDAVNDGPGFGGFPTLGPEDDFRQLLKPYDLVKLNVLGANYCENLLDMRVNSVSYSHRGFDKSTSDAWNLQFPDDSARFIEGLAWEDEYSPVVRLEFARRLVKGFINGRIPGSFADSFIRHRDGGKNFLIMADPNDKEGHVDLANVGDSVENTLKIGFRVQRDGAWVGMDALTHRDVTDSALPPGAFRSPRWWNESPSVAGRQYATTDNTTVDFTGRFWSDEDNHPLEYGFTAANAERLQVVVGEPGKTIPFLGDPNPAFGIKDNPALTLNLPDRKTRFSANKDGDKVFENPDFHYLILSKPSDGAIVGDVGYGKALLVMWDGAPEQVEVLASGKDYGAVRVTYAGPSGKVWLYPYYHYDTRDLEAVFRSAENFLAKGSLLQNGYCSQYFLNAIPAGLAAGAYLLTRYDDPMAPTA
ncbi:MAG: hypothetical protein ACOYM3_23130, partial [Terrimicrobiaceae bacterium]